MIITRVGLFSKFFGSQTPDDSASQEAVSRRVEQLLKPLLRPAIQLLASAGKTNSHLGGMPKMPSTVDWPANQNGPLTLLASIDLAEAAKAHPFDWLPTEGTLLFFYDIAEQPWGFDPKDSGGSRVVYLAPAEIEKAEIRAPGQSKKGQVLNELSVSFRKLEIPPSTQRGELAKMELSDIEWDKLADYRAGLFGGAPQHQLGGYPDPIQGDGMELECQLVTNGIYCGDTEGHKAARAEELRKGASDWQLLLQFDSDDHLGVMWGDLGRIYYWIQRQDSKKKVFGKSWVILQCY